jgi:hypothetical protein
MDSYTGILIEESLEDRSVLRRLKVISTRVEPVTERHRTPWLTQWTLHAVEIPEADARAVAEAISHALDRGHAGAWYADFRNSSHHFIIFREKVFFVDRSHAAQYEAARAYGLSLGIPAHQLDWK